MRIVYNAPEYLDSAGVEHLVHQLRIYIQEILDGQLDVTSYATKDELQSEINTINTTLSSYVTDTELQTALNNLDLSNYVTVTALNTALTNYYTKTEIDNLIPTVHDGSDGITPTIGDNGNWYLGTTDTGKPSRGEAGYTPARGTDYWTAADIATIEAYIDTELGVISNGSY